MPHDKNGSELKVGDLVTVKYRVTQIQFTKDFCNVPLETVERMPPQDTVSCAALNSRQVERVSK